MNRLRLIILLYIFGFFLFSNIVSESFAKSADEPCSYLKPDKYYRDANGNCVERSTTSAPAPITSNPYEPCSYNYPEKYIRDSNGNCQRISPVEEMSPTIFTGGVGNEDIAPTKNSGLPWDIILPVLAIMILLMLLNAKFRSSQRYGTRRLR